MKLLTELLNDENFCDLIVLNCQTLYESGGLIFIHDNYCDVNSGFYDYENETLLKYDFDEGTIAKVKIDLNDDWQNFLIMHNKKNGYD